MVWTEVENQEIIAMADAIEQKDAERAEYLIELARLRGVSLSVLVQSLGLKPEKLASAKRYAALWQNEPIFAVSIASVNPLLVMLTLQ